MPVDVYCNRVSGPCRTVLWAAKQLNVEINLKELDMQKGENLKPEYVKLNPQHTIPAMDDNGFVLVESRAIITYLADKYSKNTTLYPKDLQARAAVDQRLQFDLGVLAQRLGEYAYPVVFYGGAADEAKQKKVEEALAFLEIFLERSKFVAGPHLTLADIAIAVTVSTVEAVQINVDKYPKIKAWYEVLKKVPGYQELNEPGRLTFEQRFKANKK